MQIMQPDYNSDESTPRVLAAMTHILERLVSRNDMIDPTPTMLTSAAVHGKGLEEFRGARQPNISIMKYMERIHHYTRCSPSCFTVAFVYIDRAIHRRPGSLVVSLNIHRLILTSVMIASKVLDDTHHNNAFYARVGGVSNSELNRLELELLFLLDFDVTVSLRVFENYCLYLDKEMMGSGANQKVQKAISDSAGNGEFEHSSDDHGLRGCLSPGLHSID